MAQRGRPRKKEADALDKTAIECAEKGISYGHMKQELDSKKVVVVQNDGVKRQRAGDRVKLIEKNLSTEAEKVTELKLSDRGRKAHEAAVKEIEEDIKLHQTCIDTEQKEIDQHIGCIRTHQQAIEQLENELKEEKFFLKAFD